MTASDRNTCALRAWVALSCGLAVVATSCRGSDAGEGEARSPEFGPLAVAAFGGGDQALITGIIQITDRCVLLDERGESVLLVWPQDHTKWDGGEMAVAFDADTGGQVLLRDGDMATFGGGGSRVREDGVSADEFLEDVAWISKPDRSCVVDVRWFISDLVTDDHT